MYQITDKDCEFIKRVKNEANMSSTEHPGQAQGIKDMTDIILNFFKDKDVTLEDYQYFKTILNKIQKFLVTERMTNLNISPQFFRTVKLGLSQHVRDNALKWSLEGMYYERAYEAKVANVFDSFTGNSLKADVLENMQELSNDDNKIYLIFGGKITNIYFDRAYIKLGPEKTIFVPKACFDINVNVYTFNGKYILTAYRSDPRVIDLVKSYILDVKEDDNPQLENFGVTLNRDKYGLFDKGQTFRF